MDLNPNPPSTPASAPPNASNGADTPKHKPRKARNKPHRSALSPDTPASDARSSSTSRVSNVRDQPQHAPSPRFTAHLQPYPGPPAPAYVMNHSYPINGSPYPSSPSPFHQPTASASPANGQPPHVPVGMPTHPAPYTYAVPHAPYHGYPSYPQYPGSVVMYGTPPVTHPDAARSPAAPSPTPIASSTGKRKNSSSDLPRGPTQNSGSGSAVDTKKRTKTQRACDSCRSRKIRCDVLSDADPPICQHCKQYGFECTFFLPITETRFKKKKLEEEAAAADKDKEGERSTSSPQGEHSKSSDVKIYGPTSATYMLHSQAMISSRAYESFDLRYHHSWDVSTEGDGVIRIHEPQQGELQLALPKPVDMRIERDTVEQLVNVYFAEVAPLLPVVTREEFIASSPPPPILLYTICLVAASGRDIPQPVYESLRYAVNSLIKAEDVLSTASIVNLQALLILAMCGDCHSQFVPNALSALWIRLGSAIRMAQDMGLHRTETLRQDVELRRRLWGICVISDRWISLTYGHPFMIDVQDCDVRLPSSGDASARYLDELVRLSLILGRVLKTIYTPAGLNVATDEQLHMLLRDLEQWKANLPEELQFQGQDTGRHGGVLFMLYATVNMIFWRVFMRISYACPAHLKFALTVEKFTELKQLTGQAIDWLDAHERLYDVWLLVAYCAVSCALVQYHTWARRKDPEAQLRLKKLRDCVRKWEASLSPDHMSARRKTAEIIALLYEATQSPLNANEPPPLNPTSGVKGKPPLGGLVFQKDPSRPGGGVFVATMKPKESQVEGVPEGTIISDEGHEAGSSQHGQAQLAQQQQQQHPQPQGAQMVSYLPPDGSHSNVNPMLNDSYGSGNVQVLNVLDVPQASNNFMEQMMAAGGGILDGLPDGVGMFVEFNQWDTYFQRFAPQTGQYQQDVSMQAGSSTQSQPQYHHYGSGSSGM